MIRLLHGHRRAVASSGAPTALARRSVETSWGKTEQCPAAPAASTCPPARPNIGLRVGEDVDPSDGAYRRFTVRSVRQSSSGFHPTRPHGRAVAFGSRLPSVGPAEDLLCRASQVPAWLSPPFPASCPFSHLRRPVSLTSNRSVMPSALTVRAWHGPRQIAPQFIHTFDGKEKH